MIPPHSPIVAIGFFSWIMVAFLHPALAAETYTVSGNIRESGSHEPLAAANIRVAGTSRGTIANADGSYTLRLERGSYILIVSSLGYRADTLDLLLNANTVRDIVLQPAAIVLSEILITSEDPSLEIIRRAIASKKKWMDRLRTYEMEAFTRQTMYRDTSIASITESFTSGFWQQGDTLREIVHQRRQTANVASEFNVASVGRLLNFNDDEVRFLGYSFVGPTAHDALHYYDYTLLRTRSSHGQDVYDIQMIPRTRAVPLFVGTVSIANVSYALMGIDVQPNEAFQIPFIKEKHLRYRQQFGLYDNVYWLPADIRIDGAFTLGVIGFSFPRISFSQTSVISNYLVNISLPDSVFQKPRITVDSTAAKYDSSFWASNEVLPLSLRERHAYQTIDSTQTLEVQFRPGGIAASLGTDGDGGTLTALRYLDLSFNRVEGFHLGLQAKFDELTNYGEFTAGIARGTANSLTTYRFGATVFPTGMRRFALGGEVYRSISHRPGQGYYGGEFNSLTALLNKNDYNDYYHADGWRSSFAYSSDGSLSAELSFISEWQRSASQNTNYSLILPSRNYRANPSITGGKLRSFRLDIRIGGKRIPFDLIVPNSLELSVEHTSPSIAHSAFDFTRYHAIGTLSVPTIGRSLLFPGILRLRVAAGTSTGTLPPQRLFDIESASSSYAPFGVMRAMNVKEFEGTDYFAVNAEHNFRRLPFLVLGLPFLYENNIELILHAGAARGWNTGPLSLGTTGGWYFEEGFGFSRLFDLFRLDFTWRTSSPHRFRLTIGVGSIF